MEQQSSKKDISMKRSFVIPAGFMAVFLGGMTMAAAPQTANAAGDYCREYTRTVYIGGRAQEAYGDACMQPDGSWMIVGEGLGNDIPDNVTNVNYIIHDGRRNYSPTRVVYMTPQYKKYRNRHYEPSFVWSNNGHYRNGHYVTYRDTHKGRGNGHYKHVQNGYRDYGWNDHRRDYNGGNSSLQIRYRYDD